MGQSQACKLCTKTGFLELLCAGRKADAMTGVLKYCRTIWGSTLCPWSLLPSSFSGLLLGGPKRTPSQVNGESAISSPPATELRALHPMGNQRGEAPLSMYSEFNEGVIQAGMTEQPAGIRKASWRRCPSRRIRRIYLRGLLSHHP